MLMMLLRVLCQQGRGERGTAIAIGVFAFGHGRRVVDAPGCRLPPGTAATEGKRVVTGKLPLATRLARLLLAIAAQRRHGGEDREDARARRRETSLNFFFGFFFPCSAQPALLPRAI